MIININIPMSYEYYGTEFDHSTQYIRDVNDKSVFLTSDLHMVAL